MFSELLIAKNALESARRSYDYYQSDGFPAAKEMRRLSRIEYGAGEITYVEHVQNLSAALAVEMDNAKAIDALNQAIIKLNFIKGNLPPQPLSQREGSKMLQGKTLFPIYMTYC